MTAAEGYFIVHVHADGRREVIEVRDWSLSITQEAYYGLWFPSPSGRRVTLEGRVGEAAIYGPDDTPDFGPAPQAIEQGGFEK